MINKADEIINRDEKQTYYIVLSCIVTETTFRRNYIILHLQRKSKCKIIIVVRLI